MNAELLNKIVETLKADAALMADATDIRVEKMLRTDRLPIGVINQIGDVESRQTNQGDVDDYTIQLSFFAGGVDPMPVAKRMSRRARWVLRKATPIAVDEHTAVCGFRREDFRLIEDQEKDDNGLPVFHAMNQYRVVVCELFTAHAI